MTLAIIEAAEAKFAEAFAELKKAFAPAEKVIVVDVNAIGAATLDFIKTNGLVDLYKIAMAALIAVATGTPWATMLATVMAQGEAAGIQLVKGAEAIVLAQAQADLIAAGQIAPPVAAAPVGA